MNMKEEICMAEMLVHSNYKFYWDSRVWLFPSDTRMFFFLDTYPQVTCQKLSFSSQLTKSALQCHFYRLSSAVEVLSLSNLFISDSQTIKTYIFFWDVTLPPIFLTDDFSVLISNCEINVVYFWCLEQPLFQVMSSIIVG